MAGRIFINYRRGDEPGFTQLLYHRLESEFGRDALFMDVEGYIRAGDDFVEVLGAQVTQSQVLLAVIGPRWLDSADEQARRRLDNPEDFVRIEIAAALDQKKCVIPVLVNNASMPRAGELPKPLKPLARRNAVRLTADRFSADCTGLFKDLRDILGELESSRRAETTAQHGARTITRSSGSHRVDRQLLTFPLEGALSLRPISRPSMRGEATGDVGLSARPTVSDEKTSRSLQASIARIHEASQAPPLSPPEYRIFFGVIADEINANGVAGEQTLFNIRQRASQIGLEIPADDVRFVYEVVSMSDPSFKRGATAERFARSLRNFVVNRCRGKGMRLAADEIDLIDAWFSTG